MNTEKGNISVAVSFVIVIAVIGLIVYMLMNKKSETQPDAVNPNQSFEVTNTLDKNTENEWSKLVEERAKQKTETSIALQNNKKSMEQIAKNGDTLVMNYTGRLTNGTVFDSNVDPKFNHVQPFEFTLGAGQVIRGWDEGLLGMKVGEKKTLTIPAEKAYGSRGVGSIPPNSTLIFDVELVAIK